MGYVWKPYADRILKNATIYTVDLSIEEIRSKNYDFTVIEKGFVAVKDGKIIAVEAGYDYAKYEGEDTVIEDLEGKVIIPGLIDSHCHALYAGLAFKDVELGDCESFEDFIGKIKEKAESEKNPDSWFRGSNWNELNWSNPKMPVGKELDAVTGAHPVAAKRLCGHIMVANSRALELAGITKDTPDPVGGKIGRDENGEPDGLLYETAAMDLVNRVIPPYTEEDYIEAIYDVGRFMNALGITSLIDCNLTVDATRSYLQARKAGKLSYRAGLTFYLEKAEGDIPYHLNRIDQMMAVTGFGDDMLKMNGIKILLDGVPAGGTAYMRKNYVHMPETRGFSTITQEELDEVCRRAAEYKWQVAIHAIGDSAIDMVLEGFEEAKKAGATTENRNYIIHCVFPREDMLPKFKELEIPVTLQPSIMGCMGEEAVLCEEDAEINQPCGLFFDNGLVCGGSSDFPVVNPNPFLGMSKAISRVGLDGNVHGAEYCVNSRQALIMWTMASAYFSHDEDHLGSIEPGKCADLAVVDQAFLDLTPYEIAKTKVLKTYLAGELVYEA